MNRDVGQEMHSLDRQLETPKQLATRVGISKRQVHYLIQTPQLEYVMIGRRVHIPMGAFERFLKVMPCQDETKDRASVGSTNASVSTSPGQGMAAAASGSTGTANREQAEAIFGEWLQSRGRRTGPRDPNQLFVTELLNVPLKTAELTSILDAKTSSSAVLAMQPRTE